MNLEDIHKQKKLVRKNYIVGEKIEGDNMTDIIGYAPLNVTIQDLINAGYINSMNMLKRIIHDIDSDEQMKIFESYVLPYYRRNGIDFMEAYNEAKSKLERINSNIKKFDKKIEELKSVNNENENNGKEQSEKT
jgi:hypothetical protein